MHRIRSVVYLMFAILLTAAVGCGRAVAADPAARALAELGAVLADQHDDARAEAVLSQALAIRRKLLGDAHPDVLALQSTIAHLRRSTTEIR